MKKLTTVVLIAIIGISGLFYFYREYFHFETEREILVGGVPFHVNLADTHEENVQGLSGVRRIGESQGMLFVYSRPKLPGFWMRDMHFPIDILWIDETNTIIGITKNIAPDTYPNAFYPPAPVKYVLEINAGEAAKNNIQVGNSVEGI